MDGDTTWSLGFLIGLPGAIATFLVFVGIAIFFARKFRGIDPREMYSDRTPFKVICLTAITLAIVTIVATATSFYPYSTEYHQWVTKVGVVESKSSRIFGSKDSFQQRFVVRFKDGREFACDDTRCAVVNVGDTLTIACKRHWQYAGTDGYDCNFIDSRRED